MTEPVTDQAPTSSEYLSVEEVATALGVHRRTVLRWVDTDEIAYVRYGKVIRIPRSALEAQAKEEEAS